ncbi:MAG: transglycosylase domain-containing protein, partial [Clostridia bacterium]|nr:transglycosylase domain-containing protein [Clostridia bacterium]
EKITFEYLLLKDVNDSAENEETGVPAETGDIADTAESEDAEDIKLALDIGNREGEAGPADGTNPPVYSATRDFEPVAQTPDAGAGHTKRFETVAEKDDEKSEGGRKEQKKRKRKKRAKKPATKTGRAVGATVKGTLFTVKKLLTYALNVLLTVLLVGIITGAVVALAFVIYIKNYVNADYTGLDNLKFDSSLSTTLYYIDRTGNEVLLEDDTLESSENRMWVEYKDIPTKLVNAYIAVEDQRFWEHNGVDTTRTASAIYNFFIPTSTSYGGGSTITQQLIKNVSQENETTIQRKVQEIFRAMNVEKKYTKTEILEMYLNTIYLSHGTYGVRTAAETYFGKELSDLTLAECAALASIGKWPVHYDPISNPENNLERRNLVLKLMLEQGKITQDEFNEAYDAPITLASDDDEALEVKIHSYYIDAVMDDVVADLMKEYGYDKATASRMLYSGGLQIITCLDPGIQECAERVFTDSGYWPQKKGMQALSAICVMDQYTGELKAIVGGLGEKRESRGFNRATQG